MRASFTFMMLYSWRNCKLWQFSWFL